MANLVKVKTVITGISLFIIVIIPLLQNSFYLPAKIKRWSQLEWSDFNGIVKPFTQYGAAIASKVYLEFDTTSNRFIAYAGQNNRRSWVKSSTLDYKNGLRHEQYHFNITEYHSRLLNEKLMFNDSISEEEANKLLNQINKKLSVMQTTYDDETDHSLIREQQDYWEYKVDSLLQAHSVDDGMSTDLISGLQVWFPSTPEFTSAINDSEMPYRSYSMEKYSMELYATIFNIESQNFEGFEADLIDFYLMDSLQIDSMQVEIGTAYVKGYALVTDTVSGERIEQRWYGTATNDYKISATYPISEKHETYRQISSSFLNSFKIVNTDSIWFHSKLNYTYIPTSKTTSSQNEPLQEGKGISFCYTNYSDRSIFYKKPFTNDHGDLFLVYDIVRHADSLVKQNFIMINHEDLLDYPVDSVNQVIVVPSEILKDHNEIYFGYLVEEDSVKDCYTFYKEPIEYSKDSYSN